MLAEQVKVVLLALGVQAQVGVGLLVSAVNVMPLGRVSVMAGELDTMAVADWSVACVVAYTWSAMGRPLLRPTMT